MARCGCSGASCSCVVTGSGSVSVTGSGSVTNPFVVNGGGSLIVSDSATVDLTLEGVGSASSPYSLKADALVSLDELTDVESASAATGQVLAKQPDGQWRPVPPSTASPGSIVVGNGLEGQGTSGSPLSVKLPVGSGLIEDSTGVRVEGAEWSTWTPTLATDGSGAAPAIGNSQVIARYTRFGNTVTFRTQLIAGSTFKRGVGPLMVTLPYPARADDTFLWQPINFVMGIVGVGTVTGGAVVKDQYILRSYTPSSRLGVDSYFSHNSPSRFSTGSWLLWGGTYEAEPL